jgi:hypothetical protein
MKTQFTDLPSLTKVEYLRRYAGNLLGTNTKLKKSDMATKGLSLLPHKLAGGFDFCPSSTEGCRRNCLVDTGFAFNPKVNIGRYYKSRFFIEHRETFLDLLHEELNCFRGAVRLNMFSDLPWEKYIDMSKYEWIQFYDYTKIFDRYDKFLDKELPSNYHLTFSYSGRNGRVCTDLLDENGTVSVVFEGEVPKEFAGYTVINGDENDERWRDVQGRIVGLKWKKSSVDKDANYIATNSFVVKKGDTNFKTR